MRLFFTYIIEEGKDMRVNNCEIGWNFIIGTFGDKEELIFYDPINEYLRGNGIIESITPIREKRNIDREAFRNQFFQMFLDQKGSLSDLYIKEGLIILNMKVISEVIYEGLCSMFGEHLSYEDIKDIDPCYIKYNKFVVRAYSLWISNEHFNGDFLKKELSEGLSSVLINVIISIAWESVKGNKCIDLCSQYKEAINQVNIDFRTLCMKFLGRMREERLISSNDRDKFTEVVLSRYSKEFHWFLAKYYSHYENLTVSCKYVIYAMIRVHLNYRLNGNIMENNGMLVFSKEFLGYGHLSKLDSDLINNLGCGLVNVK